MDTGSAIALLSLSNFPLQGGVRGEFFPLLKGARDGSIRVPEHSLDPLRIGHKAQASVEVHHLGIGK